MQRPGQLTAPPPNRGLGFAALLAAALLSGAWTAGTALGATPYDGARREAGAGRLTRAIEVLDHLAATGLRTPELFDLRAQYHLAAGDQEAAERDWRRAAQLDATHARSRLSLANLYARRGLWAEALNLHREVLLFQPRNADAILGLADDYQRLGRTVGAQNLLEAASAVVDDRRVQDRWARVALAAGRPQDAERALRRVAASVQGAEKRDVLVRLAELYLSLGQPQDALAAAREALSLEPPTGAVTEAVYDAAALATDQEVGQIGETLRTSLDGLAGPVPIREEVLTAVEAARRRLAEIEKLMAGISPPQARRTAHASRLYAYALANEAALNALAYVDLGLADRREAYTARLQEAQTEMARLARAPRVGR